MTKAQKIMSRGRQQFCICFSVLDWVSGRYENTAIHVNTLAMKSLQRRHQNSDMPRRHFSLKKDTKKNHTRIKVILNINKFIIEVSIIAYIKTTK